MLPTDDYSPTEKYTDDIVIIDRNDVRAAVSIQLKIGDKGSGQAEGRADPRPRRIAINDDDVLGRRSANEEVAATVPVEIAAQRERHDPGPRDARPRGRLQTAWRPSMHVHYTTGAGAGYGKIPVAVAIDIADAENSRSTVRTEPGRHKNPITNGGDSTAPVLNHQNFGTRIPVDVAQWRLRTP